MKFVFTTACALLLSMTTFLVKAQYRPEFPELKVKEDYAKAEPLFLQVTEWITETSLDEQQELRMQSNTFLLKWITGSPTVYMMIGKQLGKLVHPNPQLLAIYMGNYASFCISNKENKDPFPAIKAGLQAVAKVYSKGIAIKTSKALDKLAAAASRNELDEYINKNMKEDLEAIRKH